MLGRRGFRERRELPWEAVEKEYVFEGPDGKQALAGNRWGGASNGSRPRTPTSTSTTACLARRTTWPAPSTSYPKAGRGRRRPVLGAPPRRIWRL